MEDGGDRIFGAPRRRRRRPGVRPHEPGRRRAEPRAARPGHQPEGPTRRLRAGAARVGAQRLQPGRGRPRHQREDQAQRRLAHRQRLEGVQRRRGAGARPGRRALARRHDRPAPARAPGGVGAGDAARGAAAHRRAARVHREQAVHRRAHERSARAGGALHAAVLRRRPAARLPAGVAVPLFGLRQHRGRADDRAGDRPRVRAGPELAGDRSARPRQHDHGHGLDPAHAVRARVRGRRRGRVAGPQRVDRLGLGRDDLDAARPRALRARVRGRKPDHGRHAGGPVQLRPRQLGAARAEAPTPPASASSATRPAAGPCTATLATSPATRRSSARRPTAAVRPPSRSAARSPPSSRSGASRRCAGPSPWPPAPRWRAS